MLGTLLCTGWLLNIVFNLPSCWKTGDFNVCSNPTPGRPTTFQRCSLYGRSSSSFLQYDKTDRTAATSVFAKARLWVWQRRFCSSIGSGSHRGLFFGVHPTFNNLFSFGQFVPVWTSEELTVFALPEGLRQPDARAGSSFFSSAGSLSIHSG